MEAQKELIEKITENELIVKEQNQVLEQKVAERTEELMKQSLELQEKNNEIQQQSEEISQHNEELYAINEILDKQHHTLKELFGDVQSSITYALRIQNAILPSKEFLKTCFDDFFVFYRPRDIVSGDFYWANEVWDKDSQKQVFVLADCTGHGVPGAFMSLICANLLNQTLIDRRIYNSADILLHVDAALRVFLKKDSNDNQDGMDCAVFVIDRNNKTLEFAGAKRPLWYFQNDKLYEIKGSSKSIGGHEREKDAFVRHIISFEEKTIFYAFTDGYPDQIGGPEKKKFMTRNLRSLLTDIRHLSTEEQEAKIMNTFEHWQSESMQIDDVLLIGFELS